MEILELLKAGSQQLKNNNINSCRLDSEILLAKIFNKKREELLINLDQKVTLKMIRSFNKLIERRSLKEPIAYILKEKEFWSKNFYVNKDTLIPRPETELMVEQVVSIFKNKTLHILDIGTGSGCILLSILSELKKSKGVGIDISSKAIDIAKKNANALGLKKRIKFFNKSLEDVHSYKFDLVVSNPPYVKSSDIKNLSEEVKRFEPKIALDGGKDGLDVIKKVIYKSKTVLKRLGWLALEIGWGQHYKVSQILKKQNFKEEFLIKDYRNNVRCILARFNN